MLDPSSASSYRHNGDDDVQQFIQKLEASAKKIMRDSNRKQKKALLDEKYGMNQSSKSGKLGSSSKVLMTSKSIATDTLGATATMNYSIPKMMVTLDANDGINGSSTGAFMGNTVNLFGDDPTAASTKQLYHPSMKTTIIPNQLSPIKTNNNGNSNSKYLDKTNNLFSSTSALPAGVPINPIYINDKTTSLKRSVVLDKLNTSPFLASSGTETLDDVLQRKDRKNKVSSTAAATESTSTWGLRLHATAVLGDKVSTSRVNKLYAKLMGKKNSKSTGKNQLEVQGPVDWSCYGLKSKYR